MKRNTKTLIAVATATALGAGALATVAVARDDNWGPGARFERASHHGAGYGHRGPRGGGMAGLFEAYDADQDGKLTQDELTNGRKAQLEKFDADGDGSLTLDEYQNLWLEAMRERMVDQFQAHDDDGDGKVTVEEFNDRFSKMVEFMDRNDDGAISRDDFRRRDGDGPRGPGMMRDGRGEGPGYGPGQGTGPKN